MHLQALSVYVSACECVCVSMCNVHVSLLIAVMCDGYWLADIQELTVSDTLHTHCVMCDGYWLAGIQELTVSDTLRTHCVMCDGYWLADIQELTVSGYWLDDIQELTVSDTLRTHCVICDGYWHAGIQELTVSDTLRTHRANAAQSMAGGVSNSLQVQWPAVIQCCDPCCVYGGSFYFAWTFSTVYQWNWILDCLKNVCLN